MKHLLVLLALAFLLPVTVHAHDDGHKSSLVIENAWARKTSRTVSAAAYLTIKNASHEMVELMGASAAIANTTMIHQSYEEDGVMKMDHVMSLPIAPGETLAFKPGSYHVMLMGLSAPLKEGDVFPITLQFKGMDPVEVIVEVTGMMGPQ